MAASNAEIVADIYAHWAKKDLDAVLPHLAEFFCHEIKLPNAVTPHGGFCEGREAALARLKALTEEFEFLKYEPGPIAANGDLVAAEVDLHYRHVPSGVEVETTLGHFWTFSNGKVVKLVEYHDLDRTAEFAGAVAAAMA